MHKVGHFLVGEQNACFTLWIAGKAWENAPPVGKLSAPQILSAVRDRRLQKCDHLLGSE